MGTSPGRGQPGAVISRPHEERLQIPNLFLTSLLNFCSLFCRLGRAALVARAWLLSAHSGTVERPSGRRQCWSLPPPRPDGTAAGAGCAGTESLAWPQGTRVTRRCGDAGQGVHAPYYAVTGSPWSTRLRATQAFPLASSDPRSVCQAR